MRKNSSKLAAAILAMVFAVVLSVLAMSTIQGKLHLDSEFADGYTLSYRLDSEDAKTVRQTAEVLEKRLYNFGATSVSAAIKDNVITFIVSGIEDFSVIRGYMTMPGVLSFRNGNDELMMDAGVLKTDSALTVSSSNNIVYVNINVADKDTFSKKTAEIATGTNTFMVLWVDFSEGTDKYETEAAAETPKYLAAATVSSAIADSCYITTHHTAETAGMMVAVVNSGPLTVSAVESNFAKVESAKGADGLKAALLSMWLLPAAALLLMLLFYGLPGLITGVYALSFVGIVSRLVSLAGAVFNSSMLMAMAAVLSVALYSNALVFERFRKELLKGRNLSSSINIAYSEYKPQLWEAPVFMAIISAVSYLLFPATLANIAGICGVAAFVSAVLFTILNKFSIVSIIDSNMLENKNLYGIKEADLPDVEKGESYEERSDRKQFDFYSILNNKFLSYAAVVLAAAGLLAAYFSDAVKQTAVRDIVIAQIIACSVFAGYNAVFHKKQRLLASAAVTACVSFASLLVITLFKGIDQGLPLMVLTVSTAVLLFALAQFRNNVKGLLREKLTKSKVQLYINETVAFLLGRPLIVACVLAFMPLLSLKPLAASILMMLLIYVGTVLLAAAAALSDLKSQNSKRRRKTRKTTEIRENTIFGINEVK